MIIGTTPTFRFSFRNVVVSEITKLNLVFVQSDKVILEKTLSDFTIVGNKLSITLTEDETLLFTPGETNYQFRYGVGESRFATRDMSIPVYGVLKGGKL